MWSGVRIAGNVIGCYDSCPLFKDPTSYHSRKLVATHEEVQAAVGDFVFHVMGWKHKKRKSCQSFQSSRPRENS